MRGTAAILVCLISLHYLSVVDAYTTRFTSENGMPGREHEDKHPRKSNDVKRSLSASQDKTMRQDYDNFESYGGIPFIIGTDYRDADMDIDTRVDEDANGFSKTLQQLMNSVIDTVRLLWGKLSGKPLESAGGESMGVDTKRQNARNEPSKKRAMKSRNGEGPETTKREIIVDDLNHLMETTRTVMDLAYHTVNQIDVSEQSEEAKKLKEAIMGILKKVKDDLEELFDDIAHGIEPGYRQSLSDRRTRSVWKRTNVRDALDPYLTSLKSQKRSKVRNSLRYSTKRNTSMRAPDMTALLNMMTEMDECINRSPTKNTSILGVKCVILPLIKVLASSKRRDANGLTMDADFNVRSNKIEPLDNLRQLNSHSGNIFVIPIYDGQPPSENTTTTTTTTTTTPSYPDQTVNDHEFDNVTTTTTEPPETTTTTTTTETLPTWPDHPIHKESDKAVRDDSRYRSKYDNDF